MRQWRRSSLTSRLANCVSPAGKHGFYSYDAKYIEGDGVALHVPANLPPPLADRIREPAIKTFRVLCCEGMARIDFFVSGEQVFVNVYCWLSPADLSPS